MPKITSTLDHFDRYDSDTGILSSYRLVYIDCGKGCKRCGRHGPYLYERIRSYKHNRTHWREKYIGKPNSKVADRILKERSDAFPSTDLVQYASHPRTCPRRPASFTHIAPYIIRCDRCGKHFYVPAISEETSL